MSRPRPDVLLAEDNPSDAELILDALREVALASRIQRVHDGAEALDWVFARGAHAAPVAPSPRLVLLDMKLPKIEGLEVLAEIRRHDRTRHVPVVMLTSSRIDRDVRAAYQMGANGYVEKPVDFVRFREVVRCLGDFWISINEPPPESPSPESPPPGPGPT